MKCMIITITGKDNYGNRLQNYASQYVLRKEVSVMTVQNWGGIRSILKLKIYLMLINLKKYFFDNNKYRREKIFFKFNKHISFEKIWISNKNCFKINWNKYDLFICGSDQIWNPHYKDNAEVNFAAFAPKEKRIAYAASFGVSEIPEERKAEYAKYLSEMKAISVREESGAKIVKELTGRVVPVLIDPTMMLDKADWQKVSKKPKFYKDDNYVLTYFLGEVDSEYREYIETICRENGYTLINLEMYNPNNYWYSTGPSEFIWLIEHCKLMCTDSFHGSVFSVLMDVPFLVFERKDNLTSMSSRIDTLLSKLRLDDRRFNHQNQSEAFRKDYSHVPQILSVEREKALNFLKSAMELDE